jgi:hypothetical protein
VKKGSEKAPNPAEHAPSAAHRDHQEGSETIPVGLELPAFQRELADFIKVIGDIHSRRPSVPSQALDNDTSEG